MGRDLVHEVWPVSLLLHTGIQEDGGCFASRGMLCQVDQALDGGNRSGSV